MLSLRGRLLTFVAVALVLAALFSRGLFVGTPVDYVAFSPTPALWVGSFYPHDPRNALHFAKGPMASGQGVFQLQRDSGAAVPGIATQDTGTTYAAYAARAGDRACIGMDCQSVETAGLLGTRTTAGGTRWSMVVAATTPGMAPYPGKVSYEGAPGDTFLAVSPGFDHSTAVLIGTDGRGSADFGAFGHVSPLRLGNAVLFAALGGLLAALLPWRAVAGWLRTEWPFATALSLVLAVEYAAIYPGLFNSDLVLSWTNSDDFLGWYSPAYMVWNWLFALVGYQWLQLLPAVITTATLAVVQNAVRQATPGWRIPVSISLVVLLLVDPYLFAATFAGQRYFVAVDLALLGLALLCAGMAAARRGNGWSWCASLVALGLAGLMRPEYWLLWVIALAFGAMRRNGGHLRVLGGAIAAAGVAYLALNVVLPFAFGTDTAVEAARYRLAAFVDYARPYACAGDQTLATALQEFGPIDRLCTGSSEDYFWDFVWPADPTQIAAGSKTIGARVIADTLADPGPQISRVLRRFADTLNQPVPQIFDKYRWRGMPDLWTPHTAISDAMGIVWDAPMVRPLYDALVHAMQSIARLPGLLWALSLAVMAIGLAGWRVAPLAAAISLAVAVIAVASIALSPVANWGYIAIVPMWAVIALHCTALERAARETRERARWRLLIPGERREAVRQETGRARVLHPASD